MEIHQRLTLFYQRLDAEPAAKTADEALALICRVLEEVEVAHCPVPKALVAPEVFDGRMYPPQPDNVQRLRNGSIWTI